MPDMPQSETGEFKVRQSFLAWLAMEDVARQEEYRKYREYYDGIHDTLITDRQRKFLQIKDDQEFNLNYCPIVVDSVAERLTVTGFKAEDNDEQRDLMWDWWQKNRMDAVQKITHKATCRDGDTYLLVEWDDDAKMPRFVFEPAWDGTEGVKVIYSSEKRDTIKLATKRWRVGADDPNLAGIVRRLNIYYPDRIEKYEQDSRVSKEWLPYREKGEPWPLPWLSRTKVPLGVPVVHFRNGDQGWQFGTSELYDVIPIQNALNKTVIDVLATADAAGFPIYVMIGDTPQDANGDQLKIAPGTWIHTTRPTSGEGSANIYKLEASDLSPLVTLKDTFVMEIARISRVPLSSFQVTGNVAAEGTLKQQESGLVAKVKDRQITFGNAWEDVMIMARRLHNAFGGGGLDEEVIISTAWADPETRNEKEHLETLQIMQALGVPDEKLWEMMEFSAEDIAAMRLQKAEEMAQSSNIGGELLRAFEGGGFGASVDTMAPVVGGNVGQAN